MAGILLEIQETVKKYADIMSKIAQVEVEVVDDKLFRVAGTGIFAAHINEDMSLEGHVYQYILRTGNTEVIYNPGKESICRECPRRYGCKEKIEISMPIHLAGDIIGVIGLVGSSEQQRDLILSGEKMYLELLSQIADFIAVKAAEVTEMKKRAVLLDTLDCVMNHVEQGILILGEDNRVTMSNDAARSLLSHKTPEGSVLTVTATGDSMNHQNEYKLKLGKLEIFVMGHLYDLQEGRQQYARVLLFERTRDLQERYYEITSTVSPLSRSAIVGGSPRTLQMQKEIDKIARSSSTVLITGESGTGKELVATAIWKASDRRNDRFIAINCGAIPEPLLESELFGYVKGAFTGADPNGRMGKFELANKGVIFLDEIGDMPLYLQVKLLRVLQERKIIRIGSNQVIPVDVRVIAATNKNLKEMMAAGKFREDLYYRLNVIPFQIPPLRERREDIQELLYFFAERYASLFGKKLWKISEEVLECLRRYPWYGNVRELENTAEFMINMMEEDGVLDIRTLPANITGGCEAASAPETEATAGSFTGTVPAIQNLKELERREIERALQLFGDDTEGKKQVAKALGIGLATLYRKLE